MEGHVRQEPSHEFGRAAQDLIELERRLKQCLFGSGFEPRLEIDARLASEATRPAGAIGLPRRPAAPPRYDEPSRPVGYASTDNFDPVVFDDHIGEQFFAGLLQQALGLTSIADRKFYIENLALPHAVDAAEIKGFQCAFDRLSLRIEDAGFEGNGDTGFHR